MSTHFKIPVATQIILQDKSERILLMLRQGTGFFDGLYSLPGGHLENGENAHQAAIRELYEEINLIIQPQDLMFWGTVHRLSDQNRIEFIFKCTTWHNEPNIQEPHKCGHLAWFSATELPKNIIPYIYFVCQQKKPFNFAELGW